MATHPPPTAASVHVLHFSDVYSLRDAARFTTIVRMEAARATEAAGGVAPLILFSGDALGPSIPGSMTEGQHMVEALRLVGVTHACLGNHEFDYGLDRLRAVVLASNGGLAGGLAGGLGGMCVRG